VRIEFNDCGVNVEVFLFDDLGCSQKVWTADHQSLFHYSEERGIPINARQLFQTVKESWAPPIIGGRYGRFHPYFAEREEKRKARE
jgi:hypothetical protein